MLTQTKAPDLNLVPSAPDPDCDRKPRQLSDILQGIADAPATPDERISLGHLIEGLENRAVGALLFIIAVPVALPIAIPGISAVLGPERTLGSNVMWCRRISYTAVLGRHIVPTRRRSGPSTQGLFTSCTGKP